MNVLPVGILGIVDAENIRGDTCTLTWVTLCGIDVAGIDPDRGARAVGGGNQKHTHYQQGADLSTQGLSGTWETGYFHFLTRIHNTKILVLFLKNLKD